MHPRAESQRRRVRRGRVERGRAPPSAGSTSPLGRQLVAGLYRQRPVPRRRLVGRGRPQPLLVSPGTVLAGWPGWPQPEFTAEPTESAARAEVRESQSAIVTRSEKVLRENILYMNGFLDF